MLYRLAAEGCVVASYKGIATFVIFICFLLMHPTILLNAFFKAAHFSETSVKFIVKDQ